MSAVAFNLASSYRIPCTYTSTTNISRFFSPLSLHPIRKDKQYTSSHRLSTRESTPSSSNGFGVTSTLISQLAIAALKLRLTEQSSVSCDVVASSSKLLLLGQVGPVNVKGKRWSSPMGLTCRAIEASVETCSLDMSAIVTRRKLVLLEPVKGDAMVALNAIDFGNFIAHPLLARPQSVDGDAIEFLKEGVQICSTGYFDDKKQEYSSVGGHGCVVFFTTCLGKRWKCVLQRGDVYSRENKIRRTALVHVEAQPSSTQFMYEKNSDTTKVTSDISKAAISEKIATSLSIFFNELVFNLDGTYLTFKDMAVHGKAKVPSVLFALSIIVRKFPSPGLSF